MKNLYLALTLSTSLVATISANNAAENVRQKLNEYVSHYNSIVGTTLRFDLVDKLAKIKLPEDATEFWMLLDAAHSNGLVEIAHGIARAYVGIPDDRKPQPYKTSYIPSIAAIDYAYKQYFLLTNNHGAMKDHDGRERTLTLREVIASKKIPVLNSKLDLSNLHLSSLEGIELYLPLPIDIFDISNNALTELPESIGNLKQVKNIDASNNKLTAIPKSIGKLDSLIRLDFSNNKLKELPEEIGSLTKLWRINLNGNYLETLPHTIKNLENLVWIWLNDNKVTHLPKKLPSKLRRLYMNNNLLTKVPDSLYELDKLQVLEIKENPVKKFPKKLRNLPNLKKFITE